MNAEPRLITTDDPKHPANVLGYPYFLPAPLAQVLAPTIDAYVQAQLPNLLPPYIDPAAQQAVATYAVQLAGSTMTGPLYLSPLLPTAPSQAATKDYVDTMIATVDTALLGYLPLTGGTLTGPLTVTGGDLTANTAHFSGVNIDVPAGNDAWVVTSVANAREWSAGTTPNGNYTITDMSAAQARLAITTTGTVELGGELICPIATVGNAGIVYPQLGSLNRIGFSWTAGNVVVYVDGNPEGPINFSQPLDALNARVTALEAEVAALRGAGVTLPART